MRRTPQSVALQGRPLQGRKHRDCATRTVKTPNRALLSTSRPGILHLNRTSLPFVIKMSKFNRSPSLAIIDGNHFNRPPPGTAEGKRRRKEGNRQLYTTQHSNRLVSPGAPRLHDLLSSDKRTLMRKFFKNQSSKDISNLFETTQGPGNWKKLRSGRPEGETGTLLEELKSLLTQSPQKDFLKKKHFTMRSPSGPQSFEQELLAMDLPTGRQGALSLKQ